MKNFLTGVPRQIIHNSFGTSRYANQHNVRATVNKPAVTTEIAFVASIASPGQSFHAVDVEIVALSVCAWPVFRTTASFTQLAPLHYMPSG